MAECKISPIKFSKLQPNIKKIVFQLLPLQKFLKFQKPRLISAVVFVFYPNPKFIHAKASRI